LAVGRDRHVGKNFTKPLAAASSVQEENSVMGINASGEVDLCDNVEIPYAIYFGDSSDRIARTIGTTSYLTGANINGEVPLFRSGWAEIPLDIDHGAIIVGDMLVVGPADNGRVVGPSGTGGGDPATAADLLRRVGWAEEAIAAPGAGLRTQATVLCVLDMHRGAP
jgi:hypothetical protein